MKDSSLLFCDRIVQVMPSLANLKEINSKGLKIKILTPLVLVLILLVVSFLVSFDQLQQKQIKEVSLNKFKETRDLFKLSLNNDVNMLAAALEIILHDEVTLRALKEKDTNILSKRNMSIFKNLNRKNRVTHFYFTGPDRVNILRLHKPGKSGDRIDRFTTLEAEKTGKIASGIELGYFGTFTLRVVAPCFLDNELIGFIELGEEIEHITRSFHDIIGIDFYILIDKEYINKQGWEEGMKMLGRKTDWDRFSRAVVINQTLDYFPDFMDEYFSSHQDISWVGLTEFTVNEHQYQSGFLRLQDAGERWVGDMVLMQDISEINDRQKKTALFTSGVTVLAGGVLFLFFYVIIGKLVRQLQGAELELRNQANQDGLTKVANRRRFDQVLQTEWRRTRRATQALSLIMCDIDYFKKYNDRYGHQAGDECLQKVAAVLQTEMKRAGDFVCRYGGEEFALILTETELEGAVQFAENISKALERTAIPHQDSAVSQYVTVSLGVACVLPEAKYDSAEYLLSLADKALYRAKENGRNQVAVHR